jgi:hypothetical protein
MSLILVSFKFEIKNCISKICRMRFTPVLLLFCVIFSVQLTPVWAQAINQRAIEPQFSKLPNGINIVAMPVAGTDKAEITLSLKTGSVYENDSVSGINSAIAAIIADRINTYLNRRNRSLSASNTTFTTGIEPEHTNFKLVCYETYIPYVFTLLRDSVFYAKFTQPEIDTALARAKDKLNTYDTIPDKVLETKLLKEVYKKDYDKINTTGNPDEFKNITLDAVLKHYNRYYLSGNCIIIATGRLSATTTIDAFSNTFTSLPANEFDPETITKIVDFHPMIYNNQFVVNKDVTNPEFHLCWQFPGTSSYRQGAFCAYLFTAIMHDENNYLQILAKRMGCKKFEVRYEPSAFSGVFRIIIQPDTGKLLATYNWLQYELTRIHKTLINESMMNAGKLIFKREFDVIKRTKEYPESIVRFWPYKDERFYMDLADSVRDITEMQLKRFVGEYLVENPHVTGLLISAEQRKAANTDSLFTDITETVADYVFTYRPNITDLEGTDNLTKLRNLTQWLKANTDVNVTVNGVSDRSEYNRLKDDTILHFIDSIPTFRKTMPDIFRKGTFRPEMLRSLKIIKQLADAGIALDRLSGTCLSAKSTDTKEELANMQCTLRFIKMRRVISLKEYHYGQGKQ